MEIVKRGYEPKDATAFGAQKAAEKLHAAAQEVYFC